MSEYSNTNKGTIAKNDRKEQDSHPDITGSINVDGKDYWINGWQKTNGKDGSKFYSLSVKPKEARSSPPQNHRASPQERDDPRTQARHSIAQELDDDLPFLCEWR